MQEVLAMETLEEMDTDGNGKIDVDEYIKHVGGATHAEDQEWIDRERNNFIQWLDKESVVKF